MPNTVWFYVILHVFYVVLPNVFLYLLLINCLFRTIKSDLTWLFLLLNPRLRVLRTIRWNTTGMQFGLFLMIWGWGSKSAHWLHCSVWLNLIWMPFNRLLWNLAFGFQNYAPAVLNYQIAAINSWSPRSHCDCPLKDQLDWFPLINEYLRYCCMIYLFWLEFLSCVKESRAETSYSQWRESKRRKSYLVTLSKRLTQPKQKVRLSLSVSLSIPPANCQ